MLILILAGLIGMIAAVAIASGSGFFFATLSGIAGAALSMLLVGILLAVLRPASRRQKDIDA